MPTLDELVPKLWAQAVAATDKANKNRRRLQRFPLLARVLLYPKFNFIRRRIALHRKASFFFASMALGGARKLRQIRRRQRLHENN